jgi:hypothetical protein
MMAGATKPVPLGNGHNCAPFDGLKMGKWPRHKVGGFGGKLTRAG